MRKLIRDWLFGDASGASGASGARAPTPILYGNDAPIYISRISNGFIVQHVGEDTYCHKAEDIAAIVVSLFAKQSLSGRQMELPLKQQLDKNLVPRGLVPNNHPRI
jgi:hypothetical protein